MSFSVWFRQWIGSFFKLLTVGTKKRKSEAQRKKERELSHGNYNIFEINGVLFKLDQNPLGA